MNTVGQPLREVAYEVAAELRSMASVGLAHSADPYDIDRYHRILGAAARLAASAEANSPTGEELDFRGNLSHVSPQVGCDAVVVHDGAVLLVQRADDRLWCLPGGWVEVGETLAEATVRELREEAGVNGVAVQLLGVFDSRVWHSLVKVHMYHCITRVEVDHPEPLPGLETLAVDFFEEASLPPLTRGHVSWLPIVFKLLRGEITAPFLDLISL